MLLSMMHAWPGPDRIIVIIGHRHPASSLVVVCNRGWSIGLGPGLKGRAKHVATGLELRLTVILALSLSFSPPLSSSLCFASMIPREPLFAIA